VADVEGAPAPPAAPPPPTTAAGDAETDAATANESAWADDDGSSDACDVPGPDDDRPRLSSACRSAYSRPNAPKRKNRHTHTYAYPVALGKESLNKGLQSFAVRKHALPHVTAMKK